MSREFLQQLVLYRTWIVAFTNAGVAWVILIIAPLGLFAVIMCTAGVFLASLANGLMCDRALMSLLAASDREAVKKARSRQDIKTADTAEVGKPKVREAKLSRRESTLKAKASRNLPD